MAICELVEYVAGCRMLGRSAMRAGLCGEGAKLVVNVFLWLLFNLFFSRANSTVPPT